MLNIQVPNKGTGPFRLKMVDRGIYQVHSPVGAFEGLSEVIFAKAVSLGIPEDELDVALEEMAKRRHNCAEFGIRGYFLFTKQDVTPNAA